MPKVSVVVPTRDRGPRLRQAVCSVAGQTWRALEVLVADDHSVDDTRAILGGVTVADDRVRWVGVSRGQGAQVARNTGIGQGDQSAPYVAFLDSDDEWSPSFLSRCVETLEGTGKSLAYTEGRIVNEADGTVEPRTGVAHLEVDGYRTILERPPGPVFSCLVVKRSCLEAIGDLDEAVVAFQEWDTLIRLIRQYPDGVAFIDEPLFTWHRHGGPRISSDGQRNARGYAQVVEKHREEILKHVGRRGLAAHYSRLAQQYRRLGDRQRERYYWARTLVLGLRGRSTAIPVVRHVMANLAGLSSAPLDPRIRVYG